MVEDVAGVGSMCAPDYSNYFMLCFFAEIETFEHSSHEKVAQIGAAPEVPDLSCSATSPTCLLLKLAIQT